MVVAHSIWNSAMNHAAAITAIPPDDFDFIIGDWRVRHRRLKTRLAGCDEWIEFEGTSTTRRILGGFGNLEDNALDLPEGASISLNSVRLFSRPD